MSATESSQNRVDRWLHQAKNHKVLSLLIVLGMCIGAIASFGDSIGKLAKLGTSPSTITSAPESSISIGTLNTNPVSNSSQTIDASTVNNQHHSSSTTVVNQLPSTNTVIQNQNSESVEATQQRAREPDRPRKATTTITYQSSPVVLLEAVAQNMPPSSVAKRLSDGTLVLISRIAWLPEKPAERGLPKINVPIGFVATLESTPRLFFVAIRSDSPEADMAVIILDYLYWNQDTTREEADQIFQHLIRDLGVREPTLTAITVAQATQGAQRWLEYKERKSKGEKRVVRGLPAPFEGGWNELRTQRDLFVD